MIFYSSLRVWVPLEGASKLYVIPTLASVS